MIAKGFTPENGAKVFAIMKSADHPRDRTRLVHRPRVLLDSSIPTRSRRTVSGTVFPATSWSAGGAAISGLRGRWRGLGPGSRFWYEAGTATSWSAGGAAISGLRGRWRALRLGRFWYEAGIATSSASTSSTGPEMTRLPPGSETRRPVSWEFWSQTLSARAPVRAQSAASSRVSCWRSLPSTANSALTCSQRRRNSSGLIMTSPIGRIFVTICN
jgi:hypothetical protein